MFCRVANSRPSDCISEGQLTLVCNKCGTERTKAVKKTEHFDSDGDHFCDECGTRTSHSESFARTQGLKDMSFILLYNSATSTSPTKKLKDNKVAVSALISDESGVYPSVDTAVFLVEGG